MKNIREYGELKKSLTGLKKDPRQLNALYEADCEIIKINAKSFLATSLDSVSEEIALGLYKDIDTWAWITVMSSVSDLCASGTIPLGLTLSTIWKFETSDEVKNQFFKAVLKACKAAEVHLLGGDSGAGAGHAFTSSIVGTSTKKPLTRMGAKPGDYIVLAHQKKTGIGPALGYQFLIGAQNAKLSEKDFRPTPKWKKAQDIFPLAKASIDTSDGIASSVSILCELNKCGVDMFWNQSINDPRATEAIKAMNLSPLFLWLGDHGDFQTMFVVEEKNLKKLPRNIAVIGQFKAKKESRISFQDKWIEFPIDKVTSCKRDLASYKALIEEYRFKLPG